MESNLGALLDEPVPALDVDVVLARARAHAVPGALHRVRRVGRQVLQYPLPVALILQEALLWQNSLRCATGARSAAQQAMPNVRQRNLHVSEL